MRRWNPHTHDTAKHIADARDKSIAALNRQHQRELPTNAHRWLEIRRIQLQREPLCRHCKREGKVVPAVEVDHIDGDSGNNLQDNLQSLCKKHHSRKTRQEGGRASYYPAWMPKTACKLVVAWGPPAAGKSTYCKDRMKPGDILIDWDDIVREICGKGRHGWDQRDADMATRERNMRIAALEHADSGNTAWIPTGAPKRSNREWWESIGGKLVAITPNRETLVDRIMADPERAQNGEEQIAAVDRFYRRLEL